MVVLDQHRRPLRSLRLSITDRCNLRCGYCMPEEHYNWLPKADVLTYEEFVRVVRATASLGVTKVRLTGGEPLLRRDLTGFVAQLAALPHLEDLALTTNAVMLESQAAPLRAAGLKRLTVSLDTLRSARYHDLTRRNELHRALAGIDAARTAGFDPVKINTVMMRGQNDDEIFDLLDFAREGGHRLRFIEYMDVGGATRWTMDAVLPASELLQRIAAHYGDVEPALSDPSAPADLFRLPSGQTFGVIASTTRPFCGSCDRARLTADGRFYTCLYASQGVSILPALRGPSAADSTALTDALRARWEGRSDRGAEERLALGERDPLARAEELRANPHLEMHTRGG